MPTNQILTFFFTRSAAALAAVFLTAFSDIEAVRKIINGVLYNSLVCLPCGATSDRSRRREGPATGDSEW